MSFDHVGWTEDDVSSSTGGSPLWDGEGSGVCKAPNGVGYPPVVFLFEFISGRSWSGVAPEPELLDELLALLVGSKILIGGCFFRGVGVDHILGHPFDVGCFLGFCRWGCSE